MIYLYCSETHPGLMRENNEDAAAIEAEAGLCVLADGMGGYNAGEVASSMAVSSILADMGQWLRDTAGPASLLDVQRAMEICVDNANLAVLTAANTNPAYAGMGTTLVVGVFRDDHLLLGHIGDSRCYRLREGVFEQITRDHSFLQEQIDAGILTPEEAAVSVNRNLVTRALGVEDVVELEVSVLPVAEGDVYLMCSDGLSDMVGDADIAQIMALDLPLQEQAARLVAAANRQGGRDNITVVLIRAQEAAAKRGLFSLLRGQ